MRRCVEHWVARGGRKGTSTLWPNSQRPGLVRGRRRVEAMKGGCGPNEKERNQLNPKP
jgi:hypothetical protein